MDVVKPEVVEINEGLVTAAAERLLEMDHLNRVVIVPKKSQEFLAEEMVRLADEEAREYKVEEPTGFLERITARLVPEEPPVSGWPVVVFGEDFFF